MQSWSDGMSCWLIGGTIPNTKEIFVEIMSRRDSATLDDYCIKACRAGNNKPHDSWYGNHSNLGYTHRTVNQNQNFVDSKTEVHTHTGPRKCVVPHQACYKKENGLKGALWDDHFLETVWKWKNNKELELYVLYNGVVRRYSL
uniref:C-type lectin domain-containing protein n=1 Tax=Heligmosomoides polygyrus TaxID=6339 RepID=A0A183GHR2_HELPZ